jgi:cytochrome bd ubiquinol oxidase subunit I
MSVSPLENATTWVDVSRVLFGFAVQFHYLFVPLTIGLAALVALFDFQLWRSDNKVYARASAFWGRFFLVNFVCGVLTGYPLRLHIQQQWSEFARLAQEVLDYVFGIEGTIAPVLFAIVAVFAVRHRLPSGWRALSSIALALVLMAQSLAILALNAWMQLPSGGHIINGHFHLDDPGALFTNSLSTNPLFSNPLWPAKVLHTLSAAWVLGGMFVMAISAWHLLQHRHRDIAQTSLRMSTWFTLVALIGTFLGGHASGLLLRDYQPAKFAALEGLWKPVQSPAPLTLLAWPDAVARKNRAAVEVPGLLGWVAADDESLNDKPLPDIQSIEADVKQRLQTAWQGRVAAEARSTPWNVSDYQRDIGILGLLHLLVPTNVEPTDEDFTAAAARAIPPVKPVFLSFRVMIGAWMLLIALTLWTALRTTRRQADATTALGRISLWLCVLALPLPWFASISGWMVAEVGRQPWVVTGIQTTSQATGFVSPSINALAIACWGLVYAAMFCANLLWSAHWIRRGPSAEREP